MGLMDMMGMMGKLKDLQGNVKAAMDRLDSIQTVGESGGGMVKVTASGKKQLVKIEIEPELVNSEQADILGDLIVAAANIALKEAEELAKNELKSATEGSIPNIPGLDLGSLFNT